MISHYPGLYLFHLWFWFPNQGLWNGLYHHQCGWKCRTAGRFHSSNVCVRVSPHTRTSTLSRVHICRDRWDRRSRKIFVDCVNFSINNANCEQIRVILWWQQGSRKKIQTSLSSARSHVQLYKIGSCQINDDKVSIVHFHVLMSFYSIYAILSQIRFCRDLRFFCVNFWGQKLRLRKFFDKYDVCKSITYRKCLGREGSKNVEFLHH